MLLPCVLGHMLQRRLAGGKLEGVCVLPMIPSKAHAPKYVPEKSSICDGRACLVVMVVQELRNELRRTMTVTMTMTDGAERKKRRKTESRIGKTLQNEKKTYLVRVKYVIQQASYSSPIEESEASGTRFFRLRRYSE